MKQILFNTEMVKAILDGRKTQSRRVIPNDWIQSTKPPIPTHGEDGCVWHFWNYGEKQSKYKVGDILCVRETFDIVGTTSDGSYVIIYKADSCLTTGKWKPSIHMPKELARIFLKVTNVRVDRLQNISHDDIYSEGLNWEDFECDNGQSENDVFKWWITLWNSTAKDGYKWEDNPYVFVYEFERVEK